MLIRLGKIKASDLTRIERVFFQLDVSHTGVLGPEDLINLSERAAMSPVRKSSRNSANESTNPVFEVERTSTTPDRETGITEDVFENPLQRKKAEASNSSINET
eukprot:COSAG05_NODE_12505_length_465_cov_1.125683_1_plen_104_part_00